MRSEMYTVSCSLFSRSIRISSSSGGEQVALGLFTPHPLVPYHPQTKIHQPNFKEIHLGECRNTIYKCTNTNVQMCTYKYFTSPRANPWYINPTWKKYIWVMNKYNYTRAFTHIGAKGFFRFCLQYFLRYFLRFAKNIANNYTNFCNPQNILQIFALIFAVFFALCKIYRKYLR